MAENRRTIGFDRKIQLNWLDATVDWAAQGLCAADIRKQLEQVLEGKVSGGGSRCARDKTTTVLLHIWVLVPASLVPLRDDGLALLRGRSDPDRLPLHWGMCMATYPYFRDVAATTGRLLALQGNAALSQITHRIAETWGERNTVIRTVRQIVRTFVLWDVLRETEERGVYSAGRQIEIAGEDGVGPWLVEAGLSNCEKSAQPFRSLVAATSLFPLKLKLSPRHLGSAPRLEVYRQGLHEDIVMLKGQGTSARRSNAWD